MSINDIRRLGREVVIRIRTTRTGVKVMRFDGESFAEGIFTKHTYRYFYGDDAREKATGYAYRKRDGLADSRDCPVTVVELGETMADKLAEVHDESGERQ